MGRKFRGHFDVVGQGPPVLCIAGFGSSNWIFKRLIAPLQDSFQFILPDNRGMGRSPLASQPYQLDDLAADSLDLMDDLGCGRFAVLGLSMGGFVAQLLALRVPERLGSISLLCTTSGGKDFKQLFPSMTEQQVRAIYEMDPLARAQAALAPEICPCLQIRYPEVYDYVVDVRGQLAVDLAQVMFQYLAVTEFMEKTLDLQSIQCPTLILSGDCDLLVPLGNAELLQKKIRNSSLAVIKETDHLFFLEKSDEVAAILKSFLTGNPY
jgi:pimeloyl-ACP methyl ester carboxylesterase